MIYLIDELFRVSLYAKTSRLQCLEGARAEYLVESLDEKKKTTVASSMRRLKASFP